MLRAVGRNHQMTDDRPQGGSRCVQPRRPGSGKIRGAQACRRLRHAKSPSFGGGPGPARTVGVSRRTCATAASSVGAGATFRGGSTTKER
jgi:hypothetical protein